jgi:transposase
MSSRAYRATRVSDVKWVQLAQGKEELGLVVGVDVGKHSLWPVCRWSDGHFERPWRVQNPKEIPGLIALLEQMRVGRKLVVAMESSGTYGDALRQALADKGIAVLRVGGKAAHDYAEVFDGVPSQHDGKDAAVVAELAALGKAMPWDYQAADLWNQELTYWVEWMVAHRKMVTIWQGRLEGLLARYWPEATQVLKLSSVTLLRVLKAYGDPKTLATTPEAAQQLVGWSRRFLAPEKIEQLLAGAGSSTGVRVGEWQRRQIQDYAQQALTARREAQRAHARLRRLAEGHTVLQAQGRVVGLATACITSPVAKATGGHSAETRVAGIVHMKSSCGHVKVFK